jgi:5-methylcytosine-specific restriction endonuclease McrA
VTNRGSQKLRRIRFKRDDYEKLRQQVLQRDSWRCQSCGAMSNLEVHHRQFRSQAGDDLEHNLITLCVACHRNIHVRPQTQKRINPHVV